MDFVSVLTGANRKASPSTPPANTPPSNGELRGFNNMPQLKGSLMDYLTGDRFEYSANPRIIDGDTIHTNNNQNKYRFFGMDAPETGHVGKSGQWGGNEARQHMQQLVGDTGVSAYFDNTDKYGRRLAYLFNPNRTETLNESMVRDGYAIPFMSHEYDKWKNNYKFGSETPYEFRRAQKAQRN